VTKGSVRRRGLIDDLAARSALKLARVDLLDPGTVLALGGPRLIRATCTHP
jgi:hypothetical protein